MSSPFNCEVVVQTLDRSPLPASLLHGILNEAYHSDCELPPLPEKGTHFPEINWDWGYDGNSILSCKSDRIVFDFISNHRAPLQDLVAASTAYPTVGFALRGENMDYPQTEHLVLVGGKLLIHQEEHEQTIENMNLRCEIFGTDAECKGMWIGDWLNATDDPDFFDPDLDYDENIEDFLSSKSATAATLATMERNVTMAPKQEDMLKSHPNYVEGYVIRHDDWADQASTMLTELALSGAGN